MKNESSFVTKTLQQIQSLEEIPKEYFMSSHEIISELIKNQISKIDESKRLHCTDFKRIARNIRTSLFHKKLCCLWQGYITNLNKANKGTYINFYFHKKKVALHRLMYCNYVNSIETEDYIKFLCQNKGYCCNVTCLKKFKYNVNLNKIKPQIYKNNLKTTTIEQNINKNLFVNFD